MVLWDLRFRSRSERFQREVGTLDWEKSSRLVDRLNYGDYGVISVTFVSRSSCLPGRPLDPVPPK